MPMVPQIDELHRKREAMERQQAELRSFADAMAEQFRQQNEHTGSVLRALLAESVRSSAVPSYEPLNSAVRDCKDTTRGRDGARGDGTDCAARDSVTIAPIRVVVSLILSNCRAISFLF